MGVYVFKVFLKNCYDDYGNCNNSFDVDIG